MWTDADRFDALVWQTVDDDTCKCGQPRSESMDPANEGAYSAKRWVCFACQTEAAAQTGMQDSNALRYSYFAVIKED